jgi:hypothetical protein
VKLPRILAIFVAVAVAGAALVAAAQKPAEKPASPAVTGPAFEDVTKAAGIDFQLTCGGAEKRYILEAMCGGVAFFDYDNDGWVDIFLLNGSTLEARRAGKNPQSKLYRNQHDGTFRDVTAKAGLTHADWGFGVAAADYDNDGNQDLYLTYFDRGVLYRNNGNGTFTDVTKKAGIGNPGRWGTSAGFGDYDNDGHLDLYIANYVDIDLNALPEFGSSVFCRYRGIPVSCGPRGLKGSRDRLYRNNGDGTFTDVGEKLNIDPGAAYGLGVLWLDFDNDGCTDIYVADDSSPSLLYKSDCKGGLTEMGVEAGVAYNADGRDQAGMGVDAADYDHSGLQSIAKTNFSDDHNNLYHNDGEGEFTDVAGPSAFGPVSIPLLGFGMKFLDYDNDGWADAFVANGHVNPQVDNHDFGVTYAERYLLFHNLRNGNFADVGQEAGAPFRAKRVGRGAAAADFNNDGAVDLLVTHLADSPALLRNAGSPRQHAVRIKLVGTKSNRDAFGARIVMTAGGMTQTQEVRANSSYLSASDPRAHFGLGDAIRVEVIEIHWPSGQVETVRDQKADEDLIIEEGKGVTRRLPLVHANPRRR